MAGASDTQFPVPALPGRRVAIVEARFHAAINDMLLAGAEATLARAGVSVRRLVVPGALEIPPTIARLHAARVADAFVALGCVIRGETYHFEIVANESSRGIMDLGVRERAVIGNGILTVETEAQALERADPQGQDKGGGAALAALLQLAVAAQIGEGPA